MARTEQHIEATQLTLISIKGSKKFQEDGENKFKEAREKKKEVGEFSGDARGRRKGGRARNLGL